jgi:hypothetical protein
MSALDVVQLVLPLEGAREQKDSWRWEGRVSYEDKCVFLKTVEHGSKA